MKFHIEDMVCGGCVKGVTGAIHSVDPNADVEAMPDTRTVVVTSSKTADAFLPALDEAGFTAEISQS